MKKKKSYRKRRGGELNVWLRDTKFRRGRFYGDPATSTLSPPCLDGDLPVSSTRYTSQPGLNPWFSTKKKEKKKPKNSSSFNWVLFGILLNMSNLFIHFPPPFIFYRSFPSPFVLLPLPLRKLSPDLLHFLGASGYQSRTFRSTIDRRRNGDFSYTSIRTVPSGTVHTILLNTRPQHSAIMELSRSYRFPKYPASGTMYSVHTLSTVIFRPTLSPAFP